MALLQVNNLTFYYEGSDHHIFDNVSFSVDTDWKLGFVGRNGKGKTTFLQLLMGKYEYTGSIHTSTVFDYFPYAVKDEYLEQTASMFLEEWKVGCEEWRVICELDKLGVDAEKLYQPFGILSHGERTKIMLAVLFSGDHDFLLIDEPTNHLDMEARETVKQYLAGKKGFILVSHDRDLLDACIDHVLVLNRSSIEVQNGNFTSWWENKEKKDAFALAENEKHKKEIAKLHAAAAKTRQWADKNEQTKIGFNPIKEPDRCISTRAYIGAKTKKMQKRVKQMEERIGNEIAMKEGLLNDMEETIDLKLMPLSHHKQKLLSARDYGLQYCDSDKPLFEHLNLEIEQGERIFLNGANGCGKSSLLKLVLNNHEIKDRIKEKGILETASGLVVSYINQDTSFLKGSIKEFCMQRNLDESLLCAVLNQLDVDRRQFAKPMEEFSEGQKKKVLIASSLMTPAHLYIWDEPLNYIDIFSRMQIEKLLLAYHPTMLIVEHDVYFREKIATKTVTF